MITPKRLIQAITDHTLSRQERIFRLLILIGMSGLAIATISGFIAGENLINTLLTTAAFFVLLAVTYVAIRYHKIQFGAVCVAIIIVYFILPVTFLTTGGMDGGAPLWFLFGVVYVCLVVERGIKYVFLASSLILCAGCYYIAYTHPELIVPHSPLMAYIDSFGSLVIVSVLTCGMILFQNSIYQSENDTAQKQKKEIEELNRIQNTFFSTMSHEIRTPINTIIGLNEMILRAHVSDEVAADAKNIQTASKMLLALINDILDMSKIEAGKMDIVPAPYDVGAMLSDIVNMIWIRAKEKGLAFHIDVDRRIPSQLFGDEVRIKQILLNILNNAVKYTEEGSISLSIQNVRTENATAYISYSVTDTGIGIKKENIPYLFTTFKRIDEEKNRHIEGTGLGLSIVKQLAELMHGDIAVNSVYTKGSTFVVTIPQKIIGSDEIGVFNIEARHALNARRQHQSFEAPDASVLIVDDNETNLMVEEKLLRDTKISIDAVLSAGECLKKTLQKRYSVILMDHLMPGMDGIECLHAIRTQKGGLNQDTPVVVLTANAGGENKALYHREGFNGYLLKPVSASQLERELLKHIPQELVTLASPEDFTGTVESPVMTYKKKFMTMISTDSICDLPKQLIEKHRIAVMPYKVVTDGGEFLDGIEAETDGLLAYLKTGNKQAHSQPPDADDYSVFFAEQLTKAQYVIHITMAQRVSRGYENAREAAKIFDNVIVIDSEQLSSGTGLLVLQAAALAVRGLTADEIARQLRQTQQKIQTSFIVDNTAYLARAGRMPAKLHKLCRALMLHPVIVLRHSAMKIGAVRIGTRNYAWKKYIEATFRHADSIDTRTLFITYAGLTADDLTGIEQAVSEKIRFERVIYQKASSAISINCGPGSFGLLFMLK